ncbi:MAG: hypothetical protein IIA45_10865 [Bacteroidetes bacterium]|nr:hypothetical protein [Bacteroidota bacterium]
MKHLNQSCKPLVFILLLAFVTSCNKAMKSLNSGDYDFAINKSVRKLVKNPHKEKYIVILEQAFARANQRDNERIEFLKKEGVPENWPKVFDTYSRMNSRQSKVRPLTPLYIESEARDAVFVFVNIDDEIIQAKNNAAEFLYANGIKLLERGDRMSAREAYAAFVQVKALFSVYRDVDAKIIEAKFAGTNKVLFDMVNATGIPLPPTFERELTKISLHELNTQWINYYTNYDSTMFYDYTIVVNMLVIDVGPEEVIEKQYTEEKEVEDGVEYVFDANGNVMKDTSGNDITVPKFKTLKAYITETHQKKIARISGSVDYYDNNSRQMLKSIPITADAIFEHHSAKVNGDLNALKPATKKIIKNKRIPFPLDFDLILQAGHTLNPLVKTAVWDNKNLIRY